MTSSKPYCAASFDMPLLSQHITLAPIAPPMWTLAQQKADLRITHNDLDTTIVGLVTTTYHGLEFYASTLWGDHTVVVDWLTDGDPAAELEFFPLAQLSPFRELTAAAELQGGTLEVPLNPLPVTGYRGMLTAEQFTPNTYYRLTSLAGWMGDRAYPALNTAVTRYVAWIIDTQGGVGWNGLIRSGAAEAISLGFPGIS